ncbi:alkylhydroperoxidase AhpD family core domain-containing protein [Parapedobacter luteus]|uniref:Alkylhydroperoxidase AhpD family core domain-containing protein n=1 Tax=Parapedobacter luteus TaxID=623280 RepID=A0A1T5BH59_9SPHI|nr:carboxymuconolactone decarboxylase family protein [Parapedobacter luteus]SKB46578.1 alkylhydroperoxidase AhpD family core domain-containing protein [Parapedobacter luteus]
MVAIEMPNRESVSQANRNYIAYFEKRIGHIPNLFLSMMHSEHAFDTYFHFQGRKNSLTLREREVVSLVMAQCNSSLYCLSAHTMIAKLNGFSDNEIMQLRQGKVEFDPKLDVLARLVRVATEHRGCDIADELSAFFGAGYTDEHLIDLVQTMGENYIGNFTAKTLQVPIDFPLAPELDKHNDHENNRK